MRTRIKICGITRVEDARLAGELGADAIGLVFYAKSPRAISAQIARQIAMTAAPFVTRVGLFLDGEPDFVREMVKAVPLDLLQFHGQEAPEQCRFGRPYIKAVAMDGGGALMDYANRYPDAAGFLLDSHAPGEAGGSGRVFDWRRIPTDFDRPLILAGGLNAENVGQAVRRAKPWGVDVNSGVEAAKGIKDPVKMQTFIKEVQRVDCEQS